MGLSVKPAGPPPATRDELIAKQRRSIHQCGRGAVLVAAADWSEVLIVPMKCKNWRCPYCGPRLRNSWAWKIAQANPERLITLTADPALHESPRAAYETMRAALPKLIRTLRKIGRSIEYAAVWELTEKGWPHLHIVQKGDFLPQKLVSKLWLQLRCGKVVDIRQVTSKRGVASYVAKYLMKTAQALDIMPKGRRLITHSAKFFPHPDATLDLEPKQDQYITWIRWETADTIDFLIQKCGYGLIPPYSGDGIHLANVSGPAGLRTIERIEAYFRDGY